MSVPLQSAALPLPARTPVGMLALPPEQRTVVSLLLCNAITLQCYNTHCRGRPHTHKITLLITTQDVSDWNQTLKLGQKATDMGIMTVNTRFGDEEDETKFKKLASSPNLAFFAKDENNHMWFLHDIQDQNLECKDILGHLEW